MFGRKRRENEQKNREYRELIDRAEAGDPDAQDELEQKWSHTDPDEQKRIDAVKAARSARLFNDLIDRAEAGDEQAQDELVDSRRTSIGQTKDHRLKRRIKRIRRIVDVRRDHHPHAAVVKAFEAWQEVRGTDKEIWYLARLLREYNRVNMEENLTLLSQELGTRRLAARRILRHLVRARYDLLLEQAPGSPEVFRELWDLIRRTRLGYNTLKRFTDRNGVERSYDRDPIPVRALGYPANWNDMVAKHFRTPALWVFRDQPERGHGDVGLLAAEALRTNDLTLAQIALAHCNSDNVCRAVLGDVFTYKLRRLVDRHHAKALQERAEQQL